MGINEFWEEYKKKSCNDKEYKEAYYFCDNEKDADELAELVLIGQKRGTASSYLCYEEEGEEIPKVGDLNIITDFKGNPKCVVETVNVDIIKFKDVPLEFAKREGEGDSSLEYWKEGHRGFFTRDLESMGKEFTEDMLVVCESFEVVYK
jgi:uncharacterized protein YhfF